MTNFNKLSLKAYQIYSTLNQDEQLQTFDIYTHARQREALAFLSLRKRYVIPRKLGQVIDPKQVLPDDEQYTVTEGLSDEEPESESSSDTSIGDQHIIPENTTNPEQEQKSGIPGTRARN